MIHTPHGPHSPQALCDYYSIRITLELSLPHPHTHTVSRSSMLRLPSQPTPPSPTLFEPRSAAKPSSHLSHFSHPFHPPLKKLSCAASTARVASTASATRTAKVYRRRRPLITIPTFHRARCSCSTRLCLVSPPQKNNRRQPALPAPQQKTSQRSTFQQPKLDGASSISRPLGRCAPSEPPSNPIMMRSEPRRARGDSKV